jgi:hypothetical protein
VKFTPDRFIPEKNPGTSLVGGWVSPREGLDFWTKDVCVDRSKIRFPDLPVSSLVTIRNEPSRFPFSDECELIILSSPLLVQIVLVRRISTEISHGQCVAALRLH